jgi:hypothetical protein
MRASTDDGAQVCRCAWGPDIITLDRPEGPRPQHQLEHRRHDLNAGSPRITTGQAMPAVFSPAENWRLPADDAAQSMGSQLRPAIVHSDSSWAANRRPWTWGSGLIEWPRGLCLSARTLSCLGKHPKAKNTRRMMRLNDLAGESGDAASRLSSGCRHETPCVRQCRSGRPTASDRREAVVEAPAAAEGRALFLGRAAGRMERAGWAGCAFRLDRGKRATKDNGGPRGVVVKDRAASGSRRAV